MLIITIVVLITALGCAFWYQRDVYVKNLPYKDIDAMIHRVNERVSKVPNITLYERDGYQNNTEKFVQTLYPNKSLDKTGTREICENYTKENSLCDSNERESNFGKIYATFSFQNVEYTPNKSILRILIYKDEAGAKRTEGNNGRCEYATMKENNVTKNKIYFVVGKNNIRYTLSQGIIQNTINEFFIDCVSDEILREQLLQFKYDELSPEMKQWIEEYLYANKVFKKMKYTN